jgi:penicillin amidase
MLRIQLDDRALLMERWRSLALGVLSAGNVAGSPPRQEFRRLLLQAWNGRASTDSVGYRLVRQFRTVTAQLAFEPFVTRARSLDPGFPETPGRALEGPAWALVTQKPRHLLDPRYADWEMLLVDAIDRTIALLTTDGRRLEERSWGEFNASDIAHPLSGGLRWFRRWLDMPRLPLPGDVHMPRVQASGFGASERMAVSPGDEEHGYFHMPSGQSGHPLSRHYRDGHDGWVRGAAGSFLPGPVVSRLVLQP